MVYVADLHIHSPFSYATSRQMDLDSISLWAKKKGIDLVMSGDVAHPMWRQELRKKLKRSVYSGIWEYAGVDFILGTEISNIFKRKGKTYKVHTLIYFSDFDVVDEVCDYFGRFGALDKDGRPTLALDIDKMCQDLLRFGENCFIIFAHMWTPWFSIFGDRSGFDGIEEVFSLGKVPENVVAFETGLSSDPLMNWGISWLDDFSLVSSSDAHSPLSLGREVSVFRRRMNFFELREILRTNNKSEFLFTVEMFPQEGKYHYDGHRKCGVKFHPKQTEKILGVCPVCGNKLTVGVLNRVMKFSDKSSVNGKNRIPFKSTVGLLDIISQVEGFSKNSKKVFREYIKCLEYGNELDWLIFWNDEKILEYNPKYYEHIKKVRNGRVNIFEGYDGIYGKVMIV